MEAPVHGEMSASRLNSGKNCYELISGLGLEASYTSLAFSLFVGMSKPHPVAIIQHFALQQVVN